MSALVTERAAPQTAAGSPAAAARYPARIGPNAVIQTAGAIGALLGDVEARRIFACAGLSDYLDEPPAGMIDEREAIRLFAALSRCLAPDVSTRVLAEAGSRTGNYILAHRIPRAAQRLLVVLPDLVASRLLLSAIERHAWTFAGSGRVRTERGRNLAIVIAGNPLAVAGCPWHTAVFERLFRTLVSGRVGVRQVACCASGASACRFEIVMRSA